MKSKKLIKMGTISLLTGLVLTGCGSSNDTKVTNDKETVAITMKGKELSGKDIYNLIKADANTQNAMRQALVAEAFATIYGDKITNKDVDAKYTELRETYGAETFDKVLEQKGLSVDDYKANLKSQLITEFGLREGGKVTDKDIENTWKTFEPTSEVKLAQFKNKKEADSFLKEEKKAKADFVKLAAKAVNKDNLTTSFDSADTSVPESVKTAAWKLKNKETSGVIEAVNSNYETEYYVVNMVKRGEKGKDMNKFKDELTEIAITNALQDTETTNKIIGNVLKEANVKIEDKDLTDLFINYQN
ncbi:peptidylprolyl isomerase [Vagococcus xieshaowenii]|uniref:peptidylprolyl isomerase n=1 Tax=Vagococcus xieshaowenii TaxID=2562451 RepID=A0A4Z0DCD2_9ENTE|nr:peptidylprolyl isomerase [Vagococcus xieshaowenii]QCA29477.1 peptidylprolyl isomerase [Vagococcus xieshaowenii]TFZ42593.1 peptidylprolyl isomerase [Vagococcus xieshaowenii]